MYSFINLMGYVGNDPEKLVAKNGKEFRTFSVGVDLFDSSPEKNVTWIKVNVWNSKLFKIVDWIRKGRLVSVHGNLFAPSAWMDAENQKMRVNLTVGAASIFLVSNSKEEKKEPQGNIETNTQTDMFSNQSQENNNDWGRAFG